MIEREKMDARAWEALFNFVFPSDAELSPSEIQEALRAGGVNCKRVKERVLAQVKAAKEQETARAALEVAKARRERISAQVARFLGLGLEKSREELLAVIQAKVSGEQQVVCFNRLEKAATDKDLRSLLEDLAILDAFGEQEEQDERSA